MEYWRFKMWAVERVSIIAKCACYLAVVGVWCWLLWSFLGMILCYCYQYYYCCAVLVSVWLLQVTSVVRKFNHIAREVYVCICY